MPIGSKLPHIVPIEIHFGPVYELTGYYDTELTPEVLERAAWDMRSQVAASTARMDARAAAEGRSRCGLEVCFRRVKPRVNAIEKPNTV